MSERSLLAVEAHPDDESIGVGGTLARYAAEGVRTTLVTATRGERGEILDKSLDPRAARPRLGSIREAELREASRILKLSELIFLGYEDSDMYGRRWNRSPRAFWRADMHEAIGRLIAIVRRVQPQVMIADNEIGSYGHPDHINAHRVAVGAFFMANDAKLYPGGEPWQPLKLYYRSISVSAARELDAAMRRAGMESFSEDGASWNMATPDERVTTRIDVQPYLDQKIAAMRAHRTQIPEDSWFMKVYGAVGPRAWNLEEFERVRSLVPAPLPENDLFAGIP
jgi:N-acetyl-1-D-myo-inositol-2-amino-2-deoxy-alpha-D-glucopyranoside deacetylase